MSETQIRDRAVAIACLRDVSERREQADRDRLHAQALEQAQFEMLARLAAVAEFRDDDTGQHTRRVGDLAVAIGRAPRAARRRSSTCYGSPRRCTTSARSRSPTPCSASPASSPPTSTRR